MTERKCTPSALPPERAFKRLVRNMRTARKLRETLHCTEIRRKRDGRVFRIVPGAVFTEVCEFLRRIGGEST